MIKSLRLFAMSVLCCALIFVFAGCDSGESSASLQGGSSPKSAAGLESPGQEQDYSLALHSQAVADDQVVLEITTNIPGTIEVMAGLSLEGQAPDDIWIGRNERVRITQGIGRAAIDVSDLPTGVYEAEAIFYPRWGFQDAESESTGISDILQASHTLTLTGTGESATLMAKRNESQKWVMDNVVMGMPWDPTDWVDRFGQWEEFPVTTRNPDIISNYYFESLDMTLVVNTLKNEIVVWRMGKDGL